MTEYAATQAGQILTDVILVTGDDMNVNSGGVGDGTQVSGGVLDAGAGGVVNDTTVYLGSVNLTAGSEANNVIMDGGSLSSSSSSGASLGISGLTINKGATADIYFDTFVKGLITVNSGTLDLIGGSTQDIQIGNSGILNVQYDDIGGDVLFQGAGTIYLSPSDFQASGNDTYLKEPLKNFGTNDKIVLQGNFFVDPSATLKGSDLMITAGLFRVHFNIQDPAAAHFFAYNDPNSGLLTIVASNSTTPPGSGVAPTLSLGEVTNGTNSVDHTIVGSVDPADAGTPVTVMDGSTVIGTTTSDDNGDWSLPFQFTGNGSAYTYNLTATATNTTGTGTSAPIPFSLDFIQNEGNFGTVSQTAGQSGGEVYALYEGLLGRAPDLLGAEGWTADLNVGMPVDQLAQALLTSPEGQSHFAFNESNSDFVSQLYHQVLGRPADAAGEQGWVNALNEGATRADVADDFVFSGEHLSRLQPAFNAGVFVADLATSEAARLYYGLLDRAPDAGGLQANAHVLKSGESLQALAQSFINSPEYQSQYANLNNSQFVTDLYDFALGRAPDQQGLQGWDNALAAGSSRASVAVGIVESPEAQTHLAGKIENGFHLS